MHRAFAAAGDAARENLSANRPGAPVSNDTCDEPALRSGGSFCRAGKRPPLSAVALAKSDTARRCDAILRSFFLAPSLVSPCLPSSPSAWPGRCWMIPPEKPRRPCSMKGSKHRGRSGARSRLRFRRRNHCRRSPRNPRAPEATPSRSRAVHRKRRRGARNQALPRPRRQGRGADRRSRCDVRVRTKPRVGGWLRMRAIAVLMLALAGCTSAAAQGFTFGGTGREYPYPSDPQYQYPYPYTDGRGRAMRRCPRGEAPYQGRCRKILWLPGSPRS